MKIYQYPQALFNLETAMADKTKTWQHNIDLSTALEKKMAINAQHYPVEKCKGTTLKYTEL